MRAQSSQLRRLLRNIELNELRNVRAFEVAVLDRTGPVQLVVPDPERTSNDGAASLLEGAQGIAVEVAGVTLDGLAEEAGLTDVDVVKIDVEGLEGAVLEGGLDLLSRDGPAIIFEYWPPLWEQCGHSLDATLDRLRSVGYSRFQNVTPRGLRPIPVGLPRHKSMLARVSP